MEPEQVRAILEQAAHDPSEGATNGAWRIQDIGVMSRWLDDRRTLRLHVWDRPLVAGDPPIHDHPFDFTSTVVAGELVDTCYVEDPAGVEYVRERYAPGDETNRTADTVRLAGTSTTLRAGATYHHRAPDLHDSRQVQGTVTVLRVDRWCHDASALTVCRRPGAEWVSGWSRPAAEGEVRRIAAAALAQLASASLGMSKRAV